MAYLGVLDDLRACIELRRPTRIPAFALGEEFDLVWNGISNGENRTCVEKAVAGILRAVEHFGYDWAMVFPDDYIEFEPLGLKMADDPDHPAMVAEYLPMTKETLSRFTLPDPARDMRLPIHLEMIRRVRSSLGDTVCVTGRIAAPFSALGLIYGIDVLMIGMLEDPGLIRENLDFFVDHQIAFGRAQMEAGAHALWLGDCVASSNFLSPSHYRDFASEAAARVASALVEEGAIVIYHTAETSRPHLKLQDELPASAINVGEGVDLAELRTGLGLKHCLMGNFDPTLLRDGTPEQVAASAGAMMGENARHEGYVFNTGEGVMANSPVANIESLMRAVIARSGG